MVSFCPVFFGIFKDARHLTVSDLKWGIQFEEEYAVAEHQQTRTQLRTTPKTYREVNRNG